MKKNKPQGKPDLVNAGQADGCFGYTPGEAKFFAESVVWCMHLRNPLGELPFCGNSPSHLYLFAED